MTSTLPLDAAARAAHGALHPESDALDVWDGVHPGETPSPAEKHEAYQVAAAAIRAAATNDALTAVLDDHDVLTLPTSFEEQASYACACDKWHWDDANHPAWESRALSHHQHVADALITALLTRAER